MRKQRGFKLLELVIVMTIICIMIGFYGPALSSAMKKAQDTSDYLSGKTEPPGKRSYNADTLAAVESPDDVGTAATSGGSTGGWSGYTNGGTDGGGTTAYTTGGSTGYTTGGTTGSTTGSTGGKSKKVGQVTTVILPQ